ncbi:MAG: hypothetical protein NTW46_02290 [Candidatus Nealsonbacteria bacterium]|nr:hypothetical protein [Candidatus Nealsonbacteria bacterium]
MENEGNNLENKPASALWITLRIFSAVFVISFFVFSGFVFNSSRNRDKLAGEEYIDIENGFTITYPKGWRVDRSNTSPVKSKNQTIISFTNPVGDIADKFLGSANLAVFFDYSEGPLSLDVSKNIIKSDMSRILLNFTVLKEERISVNNLDGYLILASDNGDKTDDISADNPSYKSLLFITTEGKSNREFFIWATAFEPSWPKYEKLFENCIKSFKIPQ